MDNSFTRAGSGLRQEGRARSSELFVGLHRLLGWLTALFELTEEQQVQAGVYLGARRRR